MFLGVRQWPMAWLVGLDDTVNDMELETWRVLDIASVRYTVRLSLLIDVLFPVLIRVRDPSDIPSVNPW